MNFLNYQVLILGGNSKEHKEWVFKLKEELSTLFSNITVQCYAHWFDDRDMIDFTFELEELKKHFSFKSNLLIIAKSVGVLLSFKAIQDDMIHPKSCVFLGTPLNWAYKNIFRIDIWSKKFQTPSLFIQNAQDPLCSSKSLKEYLKHQQVMNYQFQELGSETHNYVKFDEMKEMIKEFMEKNEEE